MCEDKDHSVVQKTHFEHYLGDIHSKSVFPLFQAETSCVCVCVCVCARACVTTSKKKNRK